LQVGTWIVTTFLTCKDFWGIYQIFPKGLNPFLNSSKIQMVNLF
jgi:hypothetical protein